MNKSNFATMLFLIGFILLFGVSLFLNTVISNSDSLSNFFNTPFEEGSQIIVENSTTRVVSYSWDFKGDTFELAMPYDSKEYVHFESLPKLQLRNYAFYVHTSSYLGGFEGEDTVDALSDRLFELAAEHDFDTQKSAAFVLSFVQSLRGTPDPDDYVQYPYETLYGGIGDCEDMAILGARLLSTKSYDVSIIQTTTHVGLGIAGRFEGATLSLTNISTPYFYAETTGSGFEIGEIPELYNFTNAQVFSVEPVAFTDISWTSAIRNTSYVFNISLTPYGGHNLAEIEVILEKELFDELNTTSIDAQTQYWMKSLIVPETYFEVNISIPEEPHRFIFKVNDMFVPTAWIRAG